MKQNIKNLSVILIDMQEFFLQRLTPRVRKELLNNQKKVIDWAKNNRIPVFVTEYSSGNQNRGEIIPIFKKRIRNLKSYKIIKLQNGGFTNTELNNLLKEHGVKRILLLGVNANGCVQDTAIGALHRGYKVLTSEGVIANVYRKDLLLSTRNKNWYRSNTTFFDSPEKLLAYLKD